MPTPADLRQALDRLEAEAPDAAKTRTTVLRRVESESGRRSWTRRTGPLLVAAVAVMLALATVVVLSIRGDSGLGEPVGTPTASRSPDASPPATELTWTFDIPNPPAGTAFRRFSISADSQRGVLERADRDGTFVITVHEPGTFDPATDLQAPQPVTVAGQAGFSGRHRADQTGYASLVWPTPQGGWAELFGFGVVTTDLSEKAAEPAQVLAEQLSVAPLVQFGRSGSPGLPFRLGWLPSGLSVQAVASDVAFGSAFFDDAGPATPGIGTVAVTRVDERRGSFAEEIDGEVGSDRTALTIGGRPAVMGPAAKFDARVLAVDLGDDSALLLLVGRPAVDRYPLHVMRRIAEEADVTMPMDDPSTWIPAPEAVAP